MRVLFVAAEIFPLAKTGGLADVSAALPAALSALSVDVRLIMPAYPRALAEAIRTEDVAELPASDGLPASRIIAALTPDTLLPLYFVDCPPLFRRGGGPYQDEDGRDWPDNAERFALLGKAAAAVALGTLFPAWRADVLHGNDWHSGLAPVYLVMEEAPRPATVLTIHNLAFQGLFPAETVGALGLGTELLSPEGIDFHGKLSFLKGRDPLQRQADDGEPDLCAGNPHPSLWLRPRRAAQDTRSGSRRNPQRHRRGGLESGQ